MSTSKVKASRRPGHAAVAKMMARLFNEPSTISDLVDVSGLHQSSVRGYVHALKREKAIHIADWEEDDCGRYSRAAYSFGTRPDAKKPARKTDHCRRERQRRERRAQQAMNDAIAGRLAA